MSPKSRGRPPSRRRKKQPSRRPGPRSAQPPGLRLAGAGEAAPLDEKTDCWFDDPEPGDRRSWVVPRAHGIYRGLELEPLDPADEDELDVLIEARHPDFADALESGAEMIADGEPFSPTLHVTLHQVVARQLLADDPPETWQTVQRLARAGYDWHNIMHMIGELVATDIHRATVEKKRFDVADYRRRLAALPGDWPTPEELDED